MRRIITLMLLLNTFFTGAVSGQVRRIAIINDVEDQLYHCKKKVFGNSFDVMAYKCDFSQSKVTENILIDLLDEKYTVEVITLPQEYRKGPGLLKSNVKQWIRSLNSQYDIVIHLYSQNRINKKYFTSNYPLYSSGLVTWSFSDEKKSQVYCSVTGRAYSTRNGIPFYHLDNLTYNASAQTLNDVMFLTNINDPEVCNVVSGLISGLIKLRFKEFVKEIDSRSQDRD